MDTLVTALGPAFAAGLAIQRLLELLDPVFTRLIGDSTTKRMVLGILSLSFGMVLSVGAGLRVLLPLGLHGADALDALVTGLIISAGTEGLNSLLKFVGYAKENKKADAAKGKAEADGSLRFVDPQPNAVK